MIIGEKGINSHFFKIKIRFHNQNNSKQKERKNLKKYNLKKKHHFNQSLK